MFILFLISTLLIIGISWNTASNTTFSDDGNYNQILGNKTYGYVEKEIYGNQNSNQTIVIITGVHPREFEFHNATAAALNDKSQFLSKKYILYRIHVTKNTMHFTIGRMNGQLLANKFVVPDVIKTKPQLVVDIHEDLWKETGYKYPRFIYPISKYDETMDYLTNITEDMPFLKIYSPGGSSPLYVTKPIARKGICTMVYETYKKDSYGKKYSDACQFIDVLDKL